jgi:hypothetical protein
MPRGPRGEKRPADVIGAAVMVAKIATGEVEETKTEKNPHAVSCVGRGQRAEARKAWRRIEVTRMRITGAGRRALTTLRGPDPQARVRERPIRRMGRGRLRRARPITGSTSPPGKLAA